MLCCTIPQRSETCLKNELGFVDPSSTVRLEAGIGVGPIGWVSWRTEAVAVWELLVAGLGHAIGTVYRHLPSAIFSASND